ncbi:MAG: DUF21 domain-containing protein [Planctomycetaceae bacterium]|nr:DUF21 domain-containing protein [Planctomycetaceae bacterium]
MNIWFQTIFAIGLFLIGMRLSAFFSGSETGFYRLSVPRLGIDSRSGDKRATQLLWFSRNPAFFVATCLIGNNVANYLTTYAIGAAVVLLFGTTNETLEVASTLVMAPVIFQFGELLPKTLYYLSPLSRLKSEALWLNGFYWLFLPLSFPLVLLTRLFEKVAGASSQQSEIVLGRNRLVQLMQFGRQEGILSDLQSRLANGLLQLAPQNVATSMIPVGRVLGVSDTSKRKEILEFARKYGLSAVAVHRDGQPEAWHGYVFVAELVAWKQAVPVIHPMPVISAALSKLEALHHLQVSDASYGLVTNGDRRPVGVVARKGLVEQLFRPELLSRVSTVG